MVLDRKAMLQKQSCQHAPSSIYQALQRFSTDLVLCSNPNYCVAGVANARFVSLRHVREVCLCYAV